MSARLGFIRRSGVSLFAICSILLAGIVVVGCAGSRIEIPRPTDVLAPLPPAAAPAPVRPRREAALLAAARREPLTIKLQTSNPNIVIYWIAN